MKPNFKTLFGSFLAVLLLATLARTLAFAGQDAATAVNSSMNADGCRFTVTAPDTMAFLSSFSATVRIEGRIRVLSSHDGMAFTQTNGTPEATPYGLADITATTFYFEDEQIDLMFRLGVAPGMPGVTAQVGIRNAGKEPMNLLSATPVSLAGQLAGNPSEWLLTSLDEDSFSGGSPPPAIPLNSITSTMNIHEWGGLYRKSGNGLFFGPVGTPTSYIDTRFRSRRDGKILAEIVADMNEVIVDPGETRWGQQVVLLLEPPRTALARWTGWVAKSHAPRTSKGSLSGWNDRNFLKNEAGRELLDVANAVRMSAGRLRPEVIQTENLDGSALSAHWLPTCAIRIAETGARFGIRLDFSGKAAPADIDSVTQAVHRAVESGFTYLKIVYPLEGINPRDRAKRTDFEIYRADWDAIRKAAGEDTYLVFCGRAPDRAAVGSVDACRTGSDGNRRDRRVAIPDTLRAYHLQGKWFAVDNDSYYIGAQLSNAGEIPGGSPLVRTWISMVGLSCGSAITSDPWYWDSSKPYWRNVEILTPPARERTDVLDLCIEPQWPRLVGHVTRNWGDWTIALLWNPATTENSVHLDFAAAGLDPERKYAVWSFWDNRYLGVATKSWTTPILPPSGSQHLCFTDLDRAADKPVVIGSSLHIYCGAAEIKLVTRLTEAMEIELTDAGAREGDLFIYSRQEPALKAATGCIVTSVSSAGENVWRISIAGRQRGVPQRVELGIPLPLVRQAWFWLLVAAAAAGVFLAAWRYVAGLRIKKEHALAEERTRIARDLHDDLGGELSSIAMLSDLTQQQAGENPAVRDRLNEISVHSRDTVRRLEEIVWAINPANDNIERFADYFCKFAQAYLELAGVRSRFDVPDQLPPRPLTSMQRHNLFLAAKEALHNAVRHGKPSEITVRITLMEEKLVVTIVDNGIGFADSPALAAAHGSSNMAGRMKDIGGTFARFSTPGQGTAVVFSVLLTS